MVAIKTKRLINLLLITATVSGVTTGSCFASASDKSAKPERENVPNTSDQEGEAASQKTAPKEPPVTISNEQRIESINQLRAKKLALPIKDFVITKMKGSFYETHFGEQHEAVDMLAPRNTPVLAVEDGTIAKLFLSKGGGNTIYEMEPARKFIYYYAHLEKYADGLKDGDSVKRGQVIGYVGTSGNAPANTPHLHFAISVMDGRTNWWRSAPVDPYDAYKNE